MQPKVSLIDFNKNVFIHCLSKYRGINKMNAEKLIDKLWRRGHLSPYEAAIFVWDIENISAVALRHITRHRTFKFFCSSNRYKRMDIKSIKEQLPENLKEIFFNYYGDFENLKNDELVYFTPACFRYNISIITDLRNLINFFIQRLDKSAHFEIRQIAEQMLEIVKSELPEINMEEWINKARWWK